MGSRKVVWVFDHQGSVYLDAQPLLATRNIDLLVLSCDNSGTIATESVRPLQIKFGTPDLVIVAKDHAACASTVLTTLAQNPLIWQNGGTNAEAQSIGDIVPFRDATDLITRLIKFFAASRVQKNIEIGLDQKNSQIILNGDRIRLTPREFDIFNYLYAAQDHTVARKEFFRQIWSGLKVCNKVLDVHVSNLRKKIQGYGFRIHFTKPDGFTLLLPVPAADPDDAAANEGSTPSPALLLAATGV